MIRVIYFLLFLVVFSESYAQKYDLIVTAEGDSITSKIDSVTDATIYFKVKFREKWVSTRIDRNDVIEYIIIPKKQPATSLKEVQKNSVYLGLGSIYYSRMFPLKRIAFTLSGGINLLFSGFQSETTLLIGGVKHFIEPGFMFVINEQTQLFRIGYRYQGDSGFIFRVAPLFLLGDSFVFPSASIGYSF